MLLRSNGLLAGFWELLTFFLFFSFFFVLGVWDGSDFYVACAFFILFSWCGQILYIYVSRKKSE